MYFLLIFLVMLPNLLGEIAAQCKLLFFQFQTHGDFLGFIVELTQKLFIVVAFSFFLIKALYMNLKKLTLYYVHKIKEPVNE